MIAYAWRAPFANAEVDMLHGAAFGHGGTTADWRTQVSEHSLGWVCAREGGVLAGFVNVAWDGAAHAFIVDTMVASRLQRQGVGSALIAVAADEARAAGCEWLHVDFEGRLNAFYIDRCGFTPAAAGLISLIPGQ